MFESLVAAVARRGDHHHPALHQPLAFVSDRRAPASEVADVMWNGQAEISAVNRNVAVPLVHVTNVLQRCDDREFGIFDRLSEHAKVVSRMSGHMPSGGGILFVDVLPVGTDDPRNVRAMRADRCRRALERDQLFNDAPIDRTFRLGVLGDLLQIAGRGGCFDAGGLREFLEFCGGMSSSSLLPIRESA